MNEYHLLMQMQIAQWGCQALKNVDMLNFVFFNNTFILIGHTLLKFWDIRVSVDNSMFLCYAVLYSSNIATYFQTLLLYYFIVVFFKGIYDYTSQTKPASKVYHVAGILCLQFMIYVMICPKINICNLALSEVCARCLIDSFV